MPPQPRWKLWDYLRWQEVLPFLIQKTCIIISDSEEENDFILKQHAAAFLGIEITEK